MKKKLAKTYTAVVEGATNGLVGDELYAFVKKTYKHATSKRIVKAAMFALSDPDIKDANLLRVIQALAIRHRLDPVEEADYIAETDEEPNVASGSAVIAEEEESAVAAERPASGDAQATDDPKPTRSRQKRTTPKA